MIKFITLGKRRAYAVKLPKMPVVYFIPETKKFYPGGIYARLDIYGCIDVHSAISIRENNLEFSDYGYQYFSVLFVNSFIILRSGPSA